jgi:hypothetical protein
MIAAELHVEYVRTIIVQTLKKTLYTWGLMSMLTLAPNLENRIFSCASIQKAIHRVLQRQIQFYVNLAKLAAT